MESTAAERRFKAIQTHLLPLGGSGDLQFQIQRNDTAGEFVHGDDTYSVILPEKLQNDKWNVYRSARSPLKLVTRFSDHPDIATLHDNFVYSVETFRDYRYLGTRVRVDGSVGEYQWITYGEVDAARSGIGSGLRKYGITKGACVGLYFVNRPEWSVVDHACSAYSYISVPLYDTLGPDAVKYISNHADLQVVGGIDEQSPILPSTSGVKLMAYSKLLNQGLNSLQPFCPHQPEDVATILLNWCVWKFWQRSH